MALPIVYALPQCRHSRHVFADTLSREPDLQIYGIAQWLDKLIKGEGKFLEARSAVFILAGTNPKVL